MCCRVRGLDSKTMRVSSSELASGTCDFFYHLGFSPRIACHDIAVVANAMHVPRDRWYVQ